MKAAKATALFLMTPLYAGAAPGPHVARVTGQVTVLAAKSAQRSQRDERVAFWLKPLDAPSPVVLMVDGGHPHPRLIQRDKVFDPHILVVEVGSQVDFPNLDPFFHNVFSLFNGKRFDLGLYESGSTRAVRFDREGVCYIFCNIHPQMSAVVVVVDTPYFAVSDSRGEIAVRDVPPGRYQAKFWEEHCASKALDDLSRNITVSEGGVSVGTIQLQESEQPATAHLNKYGKTYDPEVFESPLYTKP